MLTNGDDATKITDVLDKNDTSRAAIAYTFMTFGGFRCSLLNDCFALLY